MAQLEASFLNSPLKVEEKPDLWAKESTRVGTPVFCHNFVEMLDWRHLNVFNKGCVIACALQ